MRDILKENTLEQWEHIRTSSDYAERVSEVRTAAEECLNAPAPVLPYTKFRLFEETGNRSIYEEPYFERRKRLNVYALMTKLTGERKYIDALEDIIWLICEEYTWALPAHINTAKPVAEQKIWLDLFSCETGFALAEIYSLTEEYLSDLVKHRIQDELRTRIIESFLRRNEPWNWETVKSNWAAVCAGSIIAVFLYCAEPEEISVAISQLESTLACFLDSFTEDGCCLEGCNYWNYGFGFFVMAADLLRNYTNGEKDYFKSEKVKKIASFQQKCILRPGHTLSFSDGNAHFRSMRGLSHYLKREYPELCLPQEFAPVLADACYRWGHFIRSFLWTENTMEPDGGCLSETDIFEEAGWYICRKERYTLAAKAGHNNEPHNHNDIGSFIFCADEGQVLCDLGAGEYVKDYFGGKRYEFLVNRSLGHSLPYINGKEQASGKAYCGRLVQANASQCVMEISGAYPEVTLQSLVRSFELSEDGVSLRDEFEFSQVPSEVRERFVTLIKPIADESGGRIYFGEHMIQFEPSAFDVCVSSEEYSGHRGATITAYLIDAIAKKNERSMMCEFKII